MKTEIHIDNRGLNWKQVKHEIGHASDQLHIGFDLLYAYMFHSALVFVQTRTVMGCRVVLIVVQYGNYDNDENVMESGRLVNGYMCVYSSVSETQHMTSCVYNYIGDTVDNASEYFDKLVATTEGEVKDEKQ